MSRSISRREFLQMGLLGLGAALLPPNQRAAAASKTARMMLVGNKQGVSVYKEATDRSAIVYQRQYNEIINVYEEVIGPDGPIWNPIWYRCWGGYVFSGDLYEVRYELNPMQQPKRATGQLAEVTVPYTRSMFYDYDQGWIPVWLYYYRSTHWVMDIIEGPDGRPWYKVEDELGHTQTAVQTAHLRLIPDEEFEPISADVPPEEKRLEVSLPLQHYQAFEGERIVREGKVSTGFPTAEGKYAIKTKMPSKHMGDALLTSNIYQRIWMGVPWTSFFEMSLGMAVHGTFWHTNFGTPMSAGCINMTVDDAKWFYRWSTPVAEPADWARHGWGTVIRVFK